MFRLVLLAIVVYVIYLLVRVFMRSMQKGSSQRPEVTMPYCQKCESNRSVVVNAGHVEDHNMRWYCTRCREGF